MKYSAPCHGNAGDGLGIIMTGQYGYVPAPTFHQDRRKAQTEKFIQLFITAYVTCLLPPPSTSSGPKKVVA